MHEDTIEKLVHGGQGLATLPDGKKVFVWNALPAEVLRIRVLRSKKGFAEAIAEEIIQSSPDRIAPLEPASYLATSPWQIMNFDAENTYKKEILVETFAREKVALPPFECVAGDQQLGYRNKMEFGLWGDEEGIHLAHFVRGSHGKVRVSGSVLALPAVNNAAQAVLAAINKLDVRASDIKSVLVRASQDGRAVAAVFVKREDFPTLVVPQGLHGLVVYFSNPKSPASVPTKILQQSGERELSDVMLGSHTLHYDVLSFFQVNVPVFTMALNKINECTAGVPKVDVFSGVGSIGIPLDMTRALIESDEHNIEMARRNIGTKSIDVIHAPAEKALEHITGNEAVIVDPPRAGLHPDFTQKLLAAQPPLIAYLSCNPSTQARDVKLLVEGGYQLVTFEGYNFFP